MLPLRTEGREGKRLREGERRVRQKGMEIFQSHRVDGNGNASKHESKSHRGTRALSSHSGTLKVPLHSSVSL